MQWVLKGLVGGKQVVPRRHAEVTVGRDGIAVRDLGSHNGTLEKCPSTGMPVGILEDAYYRAGELTLAPGDVLALFSDGVPETQKIDDEDEFGEERFDAFLRRESGGDLEGAFGWLQAELAAYRGEVRWGTTSRSCCGDGRQADLTAHVPIPSPASSPS